MPDLFDFLINMGVGVNSYCDDLENVYSEDQGVEVSQKHLELCDFTECRFGVHDKDFIVVSLGFYMFSIVPALH